MWKLRPLMDYLRANFIKKFIPEGHLNLDESIVKYYGRHPNKQFIRGKPILFGYKVWCLNAELGYLVKFDFYKGKSTRGNALYENGFGKCAAPLMNMIDDFLRDVSKLPLKFYFDNLFTGFNILHYLKQRGYDGTGTIRDNRIPKSCPLPAKNTFSKSLERDDFISAIDKEDGIIVTKWLGNNVVSVASTCHGVNPTAQVKRFSQKEKRIIQVLRPSVITEYNGFMGGTDLMDENI
ncbi:Transposase IS4 [Popillia japonica]|uniref:Transposase IS4 n=1 Tax=Popillia japonica TaxID=7064 RepID=A0AAW1LS62_POPJA